MLSIVIGFLGTWARRLVFWIWGPERLTSDRLGGKRRFGDGSWSMADQEHIQTRFQVSIKLSIDVYILLQKSHSELCSMNSMNDCKS